MNKALILDEYSFNDSENILFRYERFQDEDSKIIEEEIILDNERKLTINLNKNFYFYFCTLTISILSSVYYCLILSMDKEIELVSSKIFQSFSILVIQLIEAVLNIIESKNKKKQIEISLSYEKLQKHIGSPIETPSIKIKKAKSDLLDNIDKKEMIFYVVIYGMLSFTSELLLYYFLSVATSFNTNIGIFYSFRCLEFIFLALRFPFFHVRLKIFQVIGIILTSLSISIVFIFFTPDYNGYMLIGTAITISLFKFIQNCIFQYIHTKTNDATRFIRNSNYADGMIGLMIIIFILISNKTEWIISDLGNLVKIILASLFYYFSMKMSLSKESDYKNHKVFSSLSFIFIILFDYLINRRSFNFYAFLIVCVITFNSILMFVNEKSFQKRKKNKFDLMK
jgi:hypothetical protein